MASTTPNNIPNSPNSTPDKPFGDRPFLSQIINNEEEFECIKQKILGSEITHDSATMLEYVERTERLIQTLLILEHPEKEELLIFLKLTKDIFNIKSCVNSIPSVAGEQVEYFINRINQLEIDLNNSVI